MYYDEELMRTSLSQFKKGKKGKNKEENKPCTSRDICIYSLVSQINFQF